MEKAAPLPSLRGWVPFVRAAGLRLAGEAGPLETFLQNLPVCEAWLSAPCSFTLLWSWFPIQRLQQKFTLPLMKERYFIPAALNTCTQGRVQEII